MSRRRSFAARGRARALGLLLGLLAPVGCERPEGAPRHLLLITVDTLRADRLGAYGSTLGLTPVLDNLARQAEVFSAAYAPAPFTLPSICALLTGRFPEELGITRNTAALGPDVPTLATRLRERGWRTGAVVSNFALCPAAGLDRGFEEYDCTLPELEPNRPIPARNAADTTQAALRVLDTLAAGGGPIFLWVHFMDPHGPYSPPGDLRDRYLEAERRAPDARRHLPVSADDRGLGAIPRYQYEEGQTDAAYYRAGYDGEVRHTDAEVGRLLDGLTRGGLGRDTAIVFTADHGEGLGEDDYWFAHGEYLSEPLVRIPLLVAVPGRRPRTRDDLVSLVDVAPTVMALFAGPLREQHRGRDVLAPGAERFEGSVYLATFTPDATVPRVGLVRDGHKYVATRGGMWREQLFQLVGGAERPVTSRDMAGMRRALASLRKGLRSTGTAAARTLAPGERERLRALGYVSGE
jgi:arylsulfatase